MIGLRALVAGVLLLSCAGARVLGQVGSVGPARDTGPSHGWAVVPGEQGVVLVHLPPRQAGVTGDGLAFAAAPAGTVRSVRPLRESPEAIAAVGDRAFLYFRPEATRDGPVRRVMTLRSVPAGIDGLWREIPGGLLDPAPSIPTGDRLLAVAPGGAAQFALTRGPGAVTVWRLDDAAWAGVALPEGFAPEPTAVTIVPFDRGVLLAARWGERSRAWTLAGAADWNETTLGDWSRFWDASWRRGMGRSVLAIVPADTGHGVWSITETGSSRVCVSDRGEDHPTVALVGEGRLVGMRTGTTPMEVEERSLVTGRAISVGVAARAIPVPAHEFRLLVGVVLLIMASALFVIVRPNPDRPWTVPDGTALADPGRRLIASMVDVVIVAWAVAPGFGVGARQVLTLQVLIHPGEAWLAIPATAVVGWLAMSVWEALTGTTPGKLLVGARVVRAVAGRPRRVGLFWCLVRNAMKWLIPPVAAVGLIDPQGRHRGDAAAGAVVVLRARGPQVRDDAGG